jgi:hypothetical protein
MSAVFACRGSWILSASSPLVSSLFVLLCARFLPAMCFWSGLLLLMRPCLLVTACLLLAWCAGACILSRCRPGPVLPGVAPLPSTTLGVLRSKISCGEAWSPIRFLFLLFLDALSLYFPFRLELFMIHLLKSCFHIQRETRKYSGKPKLL